MKNFFLLILLMPLFAVSQSKNVLSSSRYFPKHDKVQEFRKALGEHAKKYHTGDFSWRVWSIETGPDAGGYMVTEGPSDWTTIDGRGTLGAEHTSDWLTNVMPLTTDRYSSQYLTFDTAMSNVKMTDYADKIIIGHQIINPGKTALEKDLITRMKKVWQAGDEAVAVYSVVASGEPSYITVNRLKGGLKELVPGFRTPVNERYEAIYGAGSWTAYLRDYNEAVKERWSEMLMFVPELSSGSK